MRCGSDLKIQNYFQKRYHNKLNFGEIQSKFGSLHLTSNLLDRRYEVKTDRMQILLIKDANKQLSFSNQF